MLNVTEESMARMESDYPGIGEMIRAFEERQLPACSACGSANTAKVIVGVIGRTMSIVRATTKAVLVANDPAGSFFCWACKQSFDEMGTS